MQSRGGVPSGGGHAPRWRLDLMVVVQAGSRRGGARGLRVPNIAYQSSLQLHCFAILGGVVRVA
jgi:hypothetical protein